MTNITPETLIVTVNSLDELDRHQNRKINAFFQNEYLIQTLTLNSCSRIVFINTNCDVIYDVYNTGGRQCISNYAICINIDQLP